MKKLALAMIVRGTDEEAKLLGRCLSTLAEHVDGIFITRTHLPGQKPNKDVADVAAAYKAHLSDFEWIDDFAAARNFSFAQVPKEYDYIMWSDADDMWRGAEKLKPTLKKHPLNDGFGVLYLYDWDEYKKPIVVHWKTMIVRNDGCTKWVGRLHEDLEPTRQLDITRIEGIERLHITDKARVADNALRNLRISQTEMNANPDDPRTYWNLANSQYGAGKYIAAKDTFEHFLERTQSKEEKYLAYLRLADLYKTVSDNKSAIRNLQLAIGLEPFLPDAYYQLAYLYYELGDMDEAEVCVIRGMHFKPQEHRMIVYNPRDYDYNPMILAAKIYYRLNRPKEMMIMLKGCLKIYPDDERLKHMLSESEQEYKLMIRALTKAQKLMSIKDKEKLCRELDKLPTDMKSHPTISAFRNSHFIKEKSSGKDLVIYCGMTTHEWNPEMFKTKGVGGSEEAVIHMARQFAKLGWNVTVYNNCGHKPVINGNVTYRPFWEWNYRDKQDVTILWRWVKPVDANINTTKLYIDLHDVIPPGEFNEARLAKIDKIFVKTQFHRSLFPNVPDQKIAIIPNGMDFSTLEGSEKKDRNLIINTSSPDRSMDVLPKLFKEVKKRVPKAKMQWAYGWDIYKQSFAHDTNKLEWMKQTQKEMDEAGIETLGRLSQAEVGKLYQKAAIFAYPTEFAEIDCISVKKAQAAGCVPVTTDFGALRESVKYGWTVHSNKTAQDWAKPYQFHFGLEDERAQKDWVEFVVQELTKPSSKEAITNMKAQMQSFTWENVAARWNEILCTS